MILYFYLLQKYCIVLYFSYHPVNRSRHGVSFHNRYTANVCLILYSERNMALAWLLLKLLNEMFFEKTL